MRIDSNIAAITSQLNRLKAGVPVAAQRALNPQRWPWLEEARVVAQAVLEALAENDSQRARIPSFIAAIEADFIDQSGGLKLSMSPAIPSSFTPIERAAAAFERGEALTRAELEQLFVAWIEAPVDEGGKREKPPIPGGPIHADDDARFLTWLVYGPERGGDRHQLGARAGLGDRFLGHLRDWILSAQRPIGEEVVAAWLRAVLFAWREMAKSNFRGPFKIELGKFMKGELI